MLDKFRSYLTGIARINDKDIPYYVKWVAECYIFHQESGTNPLGLKRKPAYLRHLVATKNILGVRSPLDSCNNFSCPG